VLWFGAFIAFVLLLIVWAVVIAPGRTRKLFARLETEGWTKVTAADEMLALALEALPPVNLTSYVPDDGRRPEVTVVDALARKSPEGTRYLLQIRTTSPNAYHDGTVVTFNTFVLEWRPLALPDRSVYVLARDRETRAKQPIQTLGLRRVESGLDPGVTGLFLILQEPGDAVTLPSPLQQALLASADLFVSGAGERSRYLPNVGLRVSSLGWTLLTPEPIVMDRQLRAFLDTADRVSRALPAGA
jgi:hypothetical protein